MIKYINYEGKKLPVRVSYSAVKMIKKETGLDFTDAADQAKADMDIYELLLYYALESGHRGEMKILPVADRTEFKFTKEDMIEVLDECFMEFVRLVPQFFPNTEEVGEVPGNRQQRRALKTTK